MAITSIKHKGLRESYEAGTTKKIETSFHQKLLGLLDMLEAATETKDLKGVSDFHALEGNRKGQYWLNLQNAVDLYDAGKNLAEWCPGQTHPETSVI